MIKSYLILAVTAALVAIVTGIWGFFAIAGAGVVISVLEWLRLEAIADYDRGDDDDE